MTVAELLSRISSKELMEWMAFEQLEPFGYEIEMLGHAQTACTISNRLRSPEEEPKKIQDFMPKLENNTKEKPEQTVDDMVTAVKTLNITFGGIDKRKPK
jgi:hypothetical protein